VLGTSGDLVPTDAIGDLGLTGAEIEPPDEVGVLTNVV
jgi:hypothetical protein